MNQILEGLVFNPMIGIKANITPVIDEFNKKKYGLEQITSSNSLQDIAKAVFTISAKDFIRKTNARALAAPRSFHHVYEWGHIGETKYKLYEIKRNRITGGNLVVSYRFLDSTMRVPIPDNLKIAGKTGKFAKKRFIFTKKASVMESGKPTRPISAPKGKALVFLGNNGKPVFIRNPKSVVIKNPGGRYTTNSFNKHFTKWFNNPTNIKSAIKSTAYLKNLEKAIAKALNVKGAGRAQVAVAIKEVSNAYSKGEVAI